jgi:hypothetical protein
VSGVTVSNGGTVEVVGGIGMPPGVKLSAGAIAQSIHMKTADPACCCCTDTRRPLMTLMIVAGSAGTVIKNCRRGGNEPIVFSSRTCTDVQARLFDPFFMRISV